MPKRRVNIGAEALKLMESEGITFREAFEITIEKHRKVRND